jgi:hypothetical protein
MPSSDVLWHRAYAFQWESDRYASLDSNRPENERLWRLLFGQRSKVETRLTNPYCTSISHTMAFESKPWRCITCGDIALAYLRSSTTLIAWNFKTQQVLWRMRGVSHEFRACGSRLVERRSQFFVVRDLMTGEQIVSFQGPMFLCGFQFDGHRMYCMLSQGQIFCVDVDVLIALFERQRAQIAQNAAQLPSPTPVLPGLAVGSTATAAAASTAAGVTNFTPLPHLAAQNQAAHGFQTTLFPPVGPVDAPHIVQPQPEPITTMQVQHHHQSFPLANMGDDSMFQVFTGDSVRNIHVHGNRFAACQRRAVHVFEWPSRTALRVYDTGEEGTMLTCVRFDEHHVVGGCYQGIVYVWDFETGILLRSFRAHSMSITHMHLTGRLLVTISTGERVRIHDIEAFRVLSTTFDLGAIPVRSVDLVITEKVDDVTPNKGEFRLQATFVDGYNAGVRTWDFSDASMAFETEVVVLDPSASQPVQHRMHLAHVVPLMRSAERRYILAEQAKAQQQVENSANSSAAPAFSLSPSHVQMAHEHAAHSGHRVNASSEFAGPMDDDDEDGPNRVHPQHPQEDDIPHGEDGELAPRAGNHAQGADDDGDEPVLDAEAAAAGSAVAPGSDQAQWQNGATRRPEQLPAWMALRSRDVIVFRNQTVQIHMVLWEPATAAHAALPTNVMAQNIVRYMNCRSFAPWPTIAGTCILYAERCTPEDPVFKPAPLSMDMLLQHMPFFGLPNAQSPNLARLAIHDAAFACDLHAIHHLMANGADVNAIESRCGWTVLHILASMPSLDSLGIVHHILRHGNPLLHVRDQLGNTALHVASMCGNDSFMKAAVAHEPALMHLTNLSGKTPQDLLPSRRGHSAVLPMTH